MASVTRSRRALASARKQKQYVIESDTDDDKDDDNTEVESSNLKFGGVLATLKNDNNLKNRRNNKSNLMNCKKSKKMTSPLLKNASKDAVERVVDDVERTPPPRSIIMTRSAMREISPLTVRISEQCGSRSTVNNVPSRRCGLADSFRSDEDEDKDNRIEIQQGAKSSLEKKSKNRSLTSESESYESDGEVEDHYEDSYEDSYDEHESESSSEFEFGVDDEEFIPEEEDEEDDESVHMSDFIVDDESEGISLETISPAEKCNGIQNDWEDSNDEDTVTNHDRENKSDIEDDDSFLDYESTRYCTDVSHTNDSPTIAEDSYNNGVNVDTYKTEETPAKDILTRRTLDFDSPETQMAMIVDENEGNVDHGDILVATIIDSDSVDGETIILTFDEGGEIGKEDKETMERIQQAPPSNAKLLQNKSMSLSTDIDEDLKPQRQSLTLDISSSFSERHTPPHNRQNSDAKKGSNLAHSLEVVSPRRSVSSKKMTKTRCNDYYRQEGEVKRWKWALGARIGIGSFGQVHVGMNTETGVLMAIKQFKIDGAIMEDIRTEVELMRSFKHINIVRYLGAQMDDKFLHIFQEWVPGGSVSSLLGKFGSFSIEVIQSYISQTLNGLIYLHDNDIMHRDIKGSNILVNDEGIVKLADFGASKKLKNLSSNMMMSLTVRGTPYFMAPEVFEEKYSAKADIWGVGCVAFQMVTAMPPWKELGFSNPISLFNHIKKQNGSPPMEHPQKKSFSKRQKNLWAALKDFVQRCFNQNPSERPSAKDLLNDPFISRLSERHDDDDETVNYRSLFSPGKETDQCSSMEKLSVEMKIKSPEQHLIRTKDFDRQEPTWKSPPCSKSREENASYSVESKPCIKQPKDLVFPSPDTREWPAWAKNHLEKQNGCNQYHPSENNSTSKNNLSELMDSLALSEDSSHVGQTLSLEKRSSNTAGSTLNSNLAGLKFL